MTWLFFSYHKKGRESKDRWNVCWLRELNAPANLGNIINLTTHARNQIDKRAAYRRTCCKYSQQNYCVCFLSDYLTVVNHYNKRFPGGVFFLCPLETDPYPLGEVSLEGFSPMWYPLSSVLYLVVWVFAARLSIPFELWVFVEHLLSIDEEALLI